MEGKLWVYKERWEAYGEEKRMTYVFEIIHGDDGIKLFVVTWPVKYEERNNN